MMIEAQVSPAIEQAYSAFCKAETTYLAESAGRLNARGLVDDRLCILLKTPASSFRDVFLMARAFASWRNGCDFNAEEFEPIISNLCHLAGVADDRSGQSELDRACAKMIAETEGDVEKTRAKLSSLAIENGDDSPLFRALIQIGIESTVHKGVQTYQSHKKSARAPRVDTLRSKRQETKPAAENEAIEIIFVGLDDEDP